MDGVHSRQTARFSSPSLVGPTTRSVTVWVFVKTEVSVEIMVTVALVQRTSPRSLVDEVVGWVGSLFPKCML